MLGAGMGGGAESRQVSGSRQTDSWMPRAPGTKVALHLGERLPVFPLEKSDRVSSAFSHLPFSFTLLFSTVGTMGCG